MHAAITRAPSLGLACYAANFLVNLHIAIMTMAIIL